MARDQVIPSFLVQQDGPEINLTITGTDALLNDQGVTYNQSGFTYNQMGIDYGGIYNVNEDIVPLLSSVNNIQPSIKVLLDGSSIDITLSNTNSLLEDQGYTYNQAGLTYNQLGVYYAGVYNVNEDIVPITLSFNDIYSPSISPPSTINQSIGPGFFMFITH